MSLTRLFSLPLKSTVQFDPQLNFKASGLQNNLKLTLIASISTHLTNLVKNDNRCQNSISVSLAFSQIFGLGPLALSFLRLKVRVSTSFVLIEKNSLIALHCEVVTSSWKSVFKNSLINLDIARSVVGSQAQTINLVRLVFVTVNICLNIFLRNSDLHFRSFTFKFSHATIQQPLITLSLTIEASAPDSGHRPATALSLSTAQLRSNSSQSFP